MLELRDIHVAYSGIRAVKGVSLRVDSGELVALIGANGAGKSTLLRSISGLVRPVQGSIFLDGKDITRAETDAIVSAGLVQVPEGRQIFSRMTVEENLRLGAFQLRDGKEYKRRAESVFALFSLLRGRRNQLAGTLSGGEQQMLAIGRALMAAPRILLLDEPSLGLSPIVTQTVFEVLSNLRKDGMTMLLVEQNAFEALEISDRAYILETGTVSMEGASQKLIHDPGVKKAYLGEE